MSDTIPATSHVIRSDIRPKPATLSFGPSLGGHVSTMSGPDAAWVFEADVLVPPSGYEAYLGFHDARYGVEVPFNFAPGSGYKAPPSSGTPVLASAHSAYSKTITVTHTGQAANWEVGALFNIGDTMHRAITVNDTDANTVEIEIIPRLRVAALSGVELTTATVSLRLTDPDSGRLMRSPTEEVVTLSAVEFIGPSGLVGFGEFDGTDDYIDSNVSMGSVTSFEFECYYKTTMSTEGFIFDGRDAAGDGIAIRLSNAQAIVVNLEGVSRSHSDSSTDDGEWHYLKVTWDGSVISISIDGVPETNNDSPTISMTSDVFIGVRQLGSLGSYFDGDMRDVKMTVNGSILFFYRLGDSSGTTVTDSSDAGNDGTLTGDTGANFWNPY